MRKEVVAISFSCLVEGFPSSGEKVEEKYGKRGRLGLGKEKIARSSVPLRLEGKKTSARKEPEATKRSHYYSSPVFAQGRLSS